MPDVKIVQVGSKTSVPIAGVDVNLVEATTLPQAAALLRDALLHVDIEGGLVHVAASVGTRSLVLFGPTSLGYFGYPDNVNLFSGFCGNCWGVTERWMEICPRGYGSPRCLEKLDPARVLEAVVQAALQQLAAPSSASASSARSRTKPVKSPAAMRLGASLQKGTAPGPKLSITRPKTF